MQETFSFDELPESSGNNLEEGEHTLTITNLEQVVSKSTGSLMFQLSYIIDNNKNLKLNYDNCPLKDKDGKPINFGGNKLKKIMKATNVTVKNFTASTLKPLLVNKSFKAVLTKNEKGYLVLDAKNIDTISPLEESNQNLVDNKEEKLNLETVEIEDTNNDEGFNW